MESCQNTALSKGSLLVCTIWLNGTEYYYLLSIVSDVNISTHIVRTILKCITREEVLTLGKPHFVHGKIALEQLAVFSLFELN